MSDGELNLATEMAVAWALAISAGFIIVNK